MRKMSKTGKIVLYSFLLLASVVLLVLMIIANDSLYLAEYNAQMQQFGYYKEDVHLLNQVVQLGFVRFGFVVFLLSTFTWVGCLFLTALE